jgi:hypothetical protein
MPVQTVNTTQKRLRILGDDEIAALYEHPRFTDEERMEYFSLAPAEKAMLEQFHSIKSRLYCILQLGYFKARHLFFAIELQEVMEDAGYIQQRYFPDLQRAHSLFPARLPAQQGVTWPSVSTSSTDPLCSRTATEVWPPHWRDTKRDRTLSSGD